MTAALAAVRWVLGEEWIASDDAFEAMQPAATAAARVGLPGRPPAAAVHVPGSRTWCSAGGHHAAGAPR